MAQNRFLLGAVLLSLALASVEARTQLNGYKDMAAVLSCLQKEGTFNTFLGLLRQSGFDVVLARYATYQPFTILAPTDKAFSRLPKRISSRLKAGTLIKVVENHLLLHNYPAPYLKTCLPQSFFDTVLGTIIYKQVTAKQGQLAFSVTKKATPSTRAVVIAEDVCGFTQRSMAVQGLDNVLIPADLFLTASH